MEHNGKMLNRSEGDVDNSPRDRKELQGTGFSQNPAQCANCSDVRVYRERRETKIVCSQCGSRAVVTFVPKPGTEVLCRRCFEMAQRQSI
jgi:CxxC-x17-CxxC domain-containing protein